jgi:hypothetical protein
VLMTALIMAYQPVVTIQLASVSASQVASAEAHKVDMVLADCGAVQGAEAPGGVLGGSLQPAGMFHNYWFETYGKQWDVADAKVSVLVNPAHGILESFPNKYDLGPAFSYTPENGYLGQDKITFLVEVAGKRVKVVTTLYVVEQVDDNNQEPCGYSVKRISSLQTALPLDKKASI